MSVALVTGAGKRLGRAIAVTLARAGFDIVVHYNRSAQEATQLCRELESLGRKAWPLGADFSRPRDYERLIAAALDVAGSLRVLVNSASIFAPSGVGDLTLEGLETQLSINAWVPFVLARSFADRVGEGAIVNLLDARMGENDATHIAYLLSKRALASLTEILALAFAPRVSVNAVAPGLILPPAGKDERYLDHLAQATPFKRPGTAEDVAGAVLFLAQSRYLTGQTVYVDGGAHLGRLRGR
jgi:NAD(P)-dependent dehydrogenase (short-subunit alcohol dehydrogenase family)